MSSGGSSGSSYDRAFNAGLLSLMNENQDIATTYDNFYKYGVLYDPTEVDQTTGKTLGEINGYDDSAITSGLEYEANAISAQNSMLDSETSAAKSTNALTMAQNDAALSLLPSTTALTQAQTDAAMSLLPSTTQAAESTANLTTAQNDAALSLLPQQTSVKSAFYDSALKGVDENAKANDAQADVEQAYKNSMQTMRQNAAMTGLNPASGAFSANMVNSALDKTKAIASARHAAKTDAEDTNFNRLAAAAA